MFPRIALPALLAATGAFACAASTKCIPEVVPRQFTLVQGDVDAMLVQEYSLLNGCIEARIDSIVRRAVDPDTLRVAKNTWEVDVGTISSAVTVYGSWTSPKLSVEQAALCSKVRTERHVDSIPRSHLYYPGPADEPMEKVAPVDSDSVYVCLNGACSKIVPRVVRNVSPVVDCMVGLATPLPTPEDAAMFLRSRFASSPLKPRILDRLILVDDFQPLVLCIPTMPRETTVVLEPPAARTASIVDVIALPSNRFPGTTKWTETRFTLDNGYHGWMSPLRSWSDPSVSPRLALPSPANAGDLFQPETLQFQSSDLAGNVDNRLLSYATGVQHYEYRGSTRNHIPCGDPVVQSTPAMVGDSLRLKGLNLLLSSKATCPVDGQDVYASKFERWLYLPSGEGQFQKDFRHTFQAENEFSWPVVDDSVLVRGQKVPLATLQAFVSTLPRESRFAPLAARVVDGALSVTLASPATVRLSSPDGRILSASAQPAGTSRIELPRGHHGILLVDAGSRSLRVMVP